MDKPLWPAADLYILDRKPEVYWQWLPIMHLNLLLFLFYFTKSEFEHVEEVRWTEVLKLFGVECSWVWWCGALQPSLISTQLPVRPLWVRQPVRKHENGAVQRVGALPSLKHISLHPPLLSPFSFSVFLSGLTRGRVEVNSLGVSNCSFSFLGGGGGTGLCGCRKRTVMLSHCCFLAEVVRLSRTFEHRPDEAIHRKSKRIFYILRLGRILHMVDQVKKWFYCSIWFLRLECAYDHQLKKKKSDTFWSFCNWNGQWVCRPRCVLEMTCLVMWAGERWGEEREGEWERLNLSFIRSQEWVVNRYVLLVTLCCVLFFLFVPLPAPILCGQMNSLGDGG